MVTIPKTESRYGAERREILRRSDMPRLKVLFDSNGLVQAVDKLQLFPLFSSFNEGTWTEARLVG